LLVVVVEVVHMLVLEEQAVIVHLLQQNLLEAEGLLNRN
jgi:hypothetical protein